MEHLSNCPVCEGAEFSNHLLCKDFTVSQEEFQLVRCNNCSFVFTNPRPDVEESGKYYDSEDYISHSGTKKGIVNRLYHMVRKRALKEKRSLVCSFNSSPKVLDIGSGTGEFLNELKLAGLDVVGIEPGTAAREGAIKNYGLKIIPPEESAKLPKSSFDAISMWHVMEHVHELKAQVGQIKDLLKPGGLAVIAVPNHESFDATHYGEMWAGYDVPRHLYHFGQDQMKQLFTDQSFEFIRLQIMPFDGFYVSLLTEKYKKNKLALFSGFLTGLRTLIAAQSNSKKGSSIIYLFRKPA